MNSLTHILTKTQPDREDIIRLLSITDRAEHEQLIHHAYSIKERTIGRKVHLRGLIEFTNICRKNCLYCGIRHDNEKVIRYSMLDDEIVKAAVFASESKMTGIVLQSGEVKNKAFTKRITELIIKIKEATIPDFRFTLSLGEQTAETYKEWFKAGAQRYLLRIETSNPELYRKIHPNNKVHDFETRLQCLNDLRETGFQTGTGVMIGLPFQTVDDLADDLLFLKNRNIDMVGMGPYLEHADTPLYKYRDSLLPLNERFNLSLRMIAILRILIPDINIASTTALQTIVPMGREHGLRAGANVLMPNITPGKYRKNYLLYDNKPCIDEEADECIDCLASRVQLIGEEIASDFGDSAHYKKRLSK